MEIMLNTNNSITSIRIDALELEKIILGKRDEYFQKYHSYPLYVKLPEWIYKLAKRHTEFHCIIEGNKSEERLFGLIPCPTISIESPHDIEVF